MKTPAFQFYPDKWQSHTRRLSDSAYRVFHELICWMWQHSEDQCSVQASPEAVACAVAMPTECVRIALAEIQNAFSPLLKEEAGRWVSNGLRKEREKQIERREKAQNSANARWGDASASRKHCGSDANGSKAQCFPSPSPSPSPFPKEEGTASPPVVPEKKKLKAETVSTLPSSSVIPLPLDTENFRAAWSLWLSHLKAKRKPPTIHTQDLQLHKLSNMGVVKAIETIHHSIEHNWQGLYAKEERTFGQQNQPAPSGETQAQRDKRMILEACR